MQSESRLTYFLLLLPPLFWAGNSVLARGVADLIPPVTMSFWRWTQALCFLVPLTWKQTRRDWPLIKQGWKNILLLGLLGIASFNTLLYTAAQTTTALNIALTQSLMPVVIVIFSYHFFRERISRRQLGAIALCMAGAALVILHGDLQRLLELQFVQGDLIMLLAICLYALYSVTLRNRPPVHPLTLLTTTFSVGVVLLFPLYLWERQVSLPLELSWPVIGSLLYVATCPSILAYLCWNRGIQELGANRAGLYINLVPLFAALLAVFFLDEHFQGYHIAGALFIFSGLLLFNLPLQRSRIKTSQ